MKSTILALLLLLSHVTVWAEERSAHEAELLAQRDQASQLRDQASDLRKQADALRTEEDAACLKDIFVTACRDRAREKYLRTVSDARAKEIEANRIDTAAKTELNQLHTEELKQKAQATKHPSGEQSAKSPKPPKAAPAASGNTAQSAPVRVAPPPPSAEKIAEFEAEQQKRQHDAEVNRENEAQRAKSRAAKAREDAARYAAREKEVAARKAKRAGKQNVQQSAPATAGSEPR